MARHRLSPRRVPFLARSRRPALLGGVLGGGAALVIGIVTCAVLSTTSVGVHFTFVDRAEAAAIGARHDQPAVTRDLATAESATPTPRPTPTATAPARAATKPAAGSAAQATGASPAAAPATAAPAASAPQQTAQAAAPSASPSSSPSSSASPTSSPAATAAPAQQPSPQPSDLPGGDDCLLLILCF